ncbi:hypothetical protein [Methylomonas sp. MK1]|uniref:hypothetical protein n=1 Tax=Methylomonas sp. MK1 TaxID=1131552 RepID=UPI0003676423|nr:hypothetical protein [Methylomonas sp. MK1]
MQDINEIVRLPKAVAPVLSLRELTELLVKHYGIHEGKYDLLMEFQIGTGMFGPTPEATLPSAFVGISKIGLMPTSVESATTVDAAIVNPGKSKKSRKKKDED